MNRPIKFRVWNKDKQKWERGIGMDSSDGQLITSHNEDFELCQFTGSHDKNGKEIYEGDIVKGASYKEPLMMRTALEYIGQVRFSARQGWLVSDRLPEDGRTFPYPDEYEIIGNIYENADLLK